jgi:hypothetical protein
MSKKSSNILADEYSAKMRKESEEYKRKMRKKQK